MGDSKFDGYGGFWTLLIAGFVLLALIYAEWFLITMNGRRIHNNILSIVLAGLIIGFLYAFVMGNKYYYKGQNLRYSEERKIHYKKNDEYMVSLWIMMGVALVCSIGYFVAEEYL